MTYKELETLNHVARELNDLELGPYGLSYWEDLLKRCENHTVHGMPTISVTIDFLHETIQLPGTILVEHVKDKIKNQKERIIELKAIMDLYQVPDAFSEQNN